MARRRKGPWQRNQGGAWYTTVGRKLIWLGAADEPYEKFEDAYHEEHAKGEKPSRLVACLCDQILGYATVHRATGTYDWYKYNLDEFIATIGPRLSVEQLTPRRVSDWIETFLTRRENLTRYPLRAAVIPNALTIPSKLSRCSGCNAVFRKPTISRTDSAAAKSISGVGGSAVMRRIVSINSSPLGSHSIAHVLTDGGVNMPARIACNPSAARNRAALALFDGQLLQNAVS
jgi:hypothetical protein